MEKSKKPLVINLIGGSVYSVSSSTHTIKRVGGMYKAGQVIDRRIKMLNKYTVQFAAESSPSLWQKQNQSLLKPSHSLRESLPCGMAWNRLHHLRTTPR
jgi:hypothetical protein